MLLEKYLIPPLKSRYKRMTLVEMMQALADPASINSKIPADEVQEHALALLVNGGAPPPLLAGITNSLLDKLFTLVWSSTVEQRQQWSKQRALAWVVARITAGRRPMWADAERLGQKLHDFIGRDSQRHKRMLWAEKKEMSRRASSHVRDGAEMVRDHLLLISMEEDLCKCKYIHIHTCFSTCQMGAAWAEGTCWSTLLLRFMLSRKG